MVEIRRAQVGDADADARRTARALATQLDPQPGALILFFISAACDLDLFASELRAACAGATVLGCTTAGELGPLGLLARSAVALQFPPGEFTFEFARVQPLAALDVDAARQVARGLVEALEDRVPTLARRDMFALQLVDGLSFREERLTRAHQAGLGDIPLVGGSAGDDLRFERTRVYDGSAWQEDAALLIVGASRMPFRTFLVQNYEPGPRRMVVTGADESRRIVHELDGLPAAEVYAEACGLTSAELSPLAFAAAPVAVIIGGNPYVRAIRSVGADGSLHFYGAVEEGMVLRIARGGDLLGRLESCLARLHRELGSPALLLGFECSLQVEELRAQRQLESLQALVRNSNPVMFGTYGEQYRGVHMNQTLIGIAFGRPGAAGGTP
jgi:hypothetical protein